MAHAACHGSMQAHWYRQVVGLARPTLAAERTQNPAGMPATTEARNPVGQVQVSDGFGRTGQAAKAKQAEQGWQPLKNEPDVLAPRMPAGRANDQEAKTFQV